MKAWRDIEKSYKIIFYFAIIVIYYLFLENFYDLGYKCTFEGPVLTSGVCTWGLGHYLKGYTWVFSWFLIAVLGYFSRSKFDGMMIGVIFWVPWLIWVLFSNHRSLVQASSLGSGTVVLLPFFIMFFTILGAIVGIVFGFIGSRRRKDTSGGR
jgi:hypothetical protein